MTNQKSEGLIYITTEHDRGIISGLPYLERYFWEFIPTTRETRILFVFPHTGSKYGGIDLTAYENQKEAGVFFATFPDPQSLYHITPEGLKYLQENYSPDNPPIFTDLLRLRSDEGRMLFKTIAENLPVDSWGLGTTGESSVILGSNWGPMLFYQKP